MHCKACDNIMVTTFDKLDELCLECLMIAFSIAEIETDFTSWYCVIDATDNIVEWENPDLYSEEEKL